MDNLNDDTLIEIVKNFNNCKDIMKFTELNKKNYNFIKFNIKYILKNFIELQPEPSKTYWISKMIESINNPVSTNDQVYSSFVRACYQKEILDFPGYGSVDDFYHYGINDKTPYPLFKDIELKFNYLKTNFQIDTNNAARISTYKELSMEYLNDVLNLYRLYENDDNKRISLYMIPHIFFTSVHLDIELFKHIHTNMNYTDLSAEQRVMKSSYLLNIIRKSESGPNTSDVVNQVIELYNQLIQQDNVAKANEFLEKFTLRPRNYESLINDYQQFLKNLDGGKRKKRTIKQIYKSKHKTIKRKTIKRKTIKRKINKRKTNNRKTNNRNKRRINS